MKKALIATWIALSSTMVWAACTTHTYFIDGKMVMCTTCCVGTSCTTNCF